MNDDLSDKGQLRLGGTRILLDSPVRKLGLNAFVEEYCDLLRGFDGLTIYEHDLIVGTCERVFVGRFEEHQIRSLHTTGRLSARLMRSGASVSLDPVARAFILNSERVPRLLNRASYALDAARAFTEPDVRIEAHLRFYQLTYEGVLPALAAPVVVGMGLVAASDPAQFRLDSDGRIRLSAVSKIKHYSRFPAQQLSIGLNNHLRNASAHQRYRLLDRGRFEFWDVDQRTGKRNWGSETWTVEQLEEICEQLWRNCLGVVNGLMVFSISHRSVIDSSGLLEKVRPAKDPVRAEEIRGLATRLATIRGFVLLGFSYERGRLTLKLRTQPRGVDQDSKIMTSGGGRVRRYTVRLTYCYCSLVEQAVGLLQEIRFHINDDFCFDLKVSRYDSASLGQLVGRTEVIPAKRIPLGELRPMFEMDTLSDVSIPVLQEGLPREDS